MGERYQSEGKGRRKWVEVAHDIGAVLRKQMIEKRVLDVTSSEKKSSVNKFVKRIVESEQIVGIVPKKIYFMGNLKRIKIQKRPEDGSTISGLKSMKMFYDKQRQSSKGSGLWQKRGCSIEQERKRDATMMRSYLHKLRVQNNIRKIYHERQKQYKVWKARVTTKRNVTLPSQLFD